MVRKCFVVLLLGLLVISSSIAAAAPPIDWSKVQRISSKTELGQYVESQKRAGETIIPVILNGVNVTGNGGGHAWNWIEINGKKYFVDATLDDHSIKYGDKIYNGFIYFNAPVEIMKDTHSWDWSLAPTNLQPSVDNCYSYCLFYNSLARANSVEAGLKLIEQKLKEKNGWFSVVVPYDERYSDNENVMKPAMQKVSNESGKNFVYAYWQRGKYTFIHVHTR